LFAGLLVFVEGYEGGSSVRRRGDADKSHLREKLPRSGVIVGEDADGPVQLALPDLRFAIWAVCRLFVNSTASSAPPSAFRDRSTDLQVHGSRAARLKGA
jgi:hypothetical protein